MATIIESAGVEPNKLLIDKEGRAQVFSTVEAEDRHVNKKNGTTWTLSVATVTPTAVDDYFFYFQNTGSETYLFTDFRFIGAAATVLDIDCVTGTALGATAAPIVPLSRNTGKIPTMTATIFQDVDITGLTPKGDWFFQQIETAAKMNHLRTSSGIVIEPGGALAIRSSVATAIRGTASVYKVELNE